MEYEVGDIIEFNSRTRWFMGVIVRKNDNINYDFEVEVLSKYVHKDGTAVSTSSGDILYLDLSLNNHGKYTKLLSDNYEVARVLFGGL